MLKHTHRWFYLTFRSAQRGRGCSSLGRAGKNLNPGLLTPEHPILTLQFENGKAQRWEVLKPFALSRRLTCLYLLCLAAIPVSGGLRLLVFIVLGQPALLWQEQPRQSPAPAGVHPHPCDT